MSAPAQGLGNKPRLTTRRAFTLVEVAVTIALVGIALAWLLQSLNASKITAANARNVKLARELALLTLGQIESGLFEDELEGERIEGSYADEGYPDFSFEAVIGEENFRPDESDAAAFDNWRHEQQLKRQNEDSEEEDAEQPYEKIQIKVTFPKIQDSANEFVIEKWVPWEQIHPPEEDSAEGGADPASSDAASGSGGK